MPIILWNILTKTSNLFIWWNPTILNILYDLIQFIMFTIGGNCMVIWKMIHLHLVCNVLKFKCTIPTREMCKYNVKGDISSSKNNEIWNIENFVFVYQKNLFPNCILCLLEFGNLQMCFRTIPRVQIYSTFNFLIHEFDLL